MSVECWPSHQESKSAGCTCEWWGRDEIVDFDPACPILERHKPPHDSATANVTLTFREAAALRVALEDLLLLRGDKMAAPLVDTLNAVHRKLASNPPSHQLTSG